ncbi:FtsX-like permease family protein [Sphaerisporangium corydalis]|uniref:FtsX-like permease family protein n=1 Tax=Sphaerisporangium corydalis TaxID=1441875 RepID=A0ABV9EJZ9_9ACTN|nr:FtsX-like permease family protein [Sphaerisporangium corydalis]
MSVRAALRSPGLRRPLAPHWPSVRGRALTDAGPLLLAAAVVAAVTLLAGAVPPLLRATADEAVQDAVRRAGSEVVVHAGWEHDDGPGGGRVRTPSLAEDIDGFRDKAIDALGPRLLAVLRPPVATVTSTVLTITDGSVQRTFQLTYLAKAPNAGGGPHVTWIAGGPPRAGVPVIEVPYDGTPWPVQVGLSEADAGALGVRPGDRIPLKDDQNNVKDVQVSGVFRATDSADPAWLLAPWLLRPVSGADGAGSTRLAGLLSPDSLPDARLAFDDDHLQRTVRFAPDPGALTSDSADALAATVVALKAASASSGDLGSSLKWETRFDAVLRDVRTQVGAASAQASVLLIDVLAVAILVLLLAADLLVRRRAPALAAARQRGAGLPDLGAELVLESAGVAILAAAAGLALARTVAPDASWGWAVPVVLAAAAAGPAFGTLAAARATRDRRVPANRTARRWARRTRQLRRATLEAAVMIAAVAAFVALAQRGILPADPVGTAGPESGPDGATLPASTPALGALAGTLVLLRLLPAGTRLVLKRALRSRRPLAVFGSARAAATSARVLPLLVLVTSAALASFALTLDATAGQGLADGAWRTVGADARLDLTPGPAASTPGPATSTPGATAPTPGPSASTPAPTPGPAAATPALARRIAAAPGVRQVVTAQVTDRARVRADSLAVAPRLVIVNAAEFQRLLAATPLPGAPALSRLVTAGHGDVPALVRSSDGGLRPGMRLELVRDGAPAIRLVAAGTAPAIGDADDVVLVDAAAVAAAGMPAVPNTVWVTGPGSARAVAANAGAGHAVLLADVLRERRAAPLTSGLLRLAWASAAALLALGLLGLVLGAAASAPDRWQTLTRLRTLGLRPRDARWVAAGELLPPVLVAAVAGPLLGALLARLTLGPLALRLLTGQAADPALALSWWRLGLVAVALLVTVVAVVPIESRLRRRRRLSEVLRAGEG